MGAPLELLFGIEDNVIDTYYKSFLLEFLASSLLISISTRNDFAISSLKVKEDPVQR